MKARYKSLYTLLVIFMMVMFSCAGDDEPTTQDLVFEKLSGSWDLNEGGSILVDGQNASANFPDFSITIADGTYTTSNAGNLFSATGTWEWLDEEAQRFLLDDGKDITIVELTETRFVFGFVTNSQGGVANGIGGSYTITVNK